jgi:hypothetical protein
MTERKTPQGEPLTIPGYVTSQEAAELLARDGKPLSTSTIRVLVMKNELGTPHYIGRAMLLELEAVKSYLARRGPRYGARWQDKK